MLYEQYRSKIAKVADILATLRRFRILIISICAFIAVLTATLLGISGTVYDVAECPSSIEAGAELPYRAGAVFNGVEYEFSVSGSDEWTAKMPTRPGEYLVRSFSRDIAGKPRYSKAHAFTVIPRTVTVTADCSEAVYGELPSVKADLLYSDQIVCSAFTYSDYASATSTVEPVAEAITVYDEDGNDVTYTYNFMTQSSRLDFIKREISVTLSPYTADYDGKEHPKIPYTGYEISGETPLAEGDTEEVFVTVFRTAPGEYENEVDFKIYRQTESGKVEVTSNYSITVSSGTLTLNYRTLEITTSDFTAVYDGQEKSDSGFTLSESSLTALKEAGHNISVSKGTVEKNAGDYQNELEFIITDEGGNDVTSNYSFDFTYGTLKILPRPITCNTYSSEWIYDGQVHTGNTGFVILKNSSGSYASEDESAYFVEGSESKVKEVKDSCENKISIGIFNNATGEDVTANYAVNYIYGDLTIIPRPIEVTVVGEEWEYDGDPHFSNKHTISFDKDVIDRALLEGHTVTARGLKSITAVGRAQNSIDFGIYEGDTVVTDNYKIKWYNGDIVVTPRKISLCAKSYQKIYDGTPLTSGGIEVVSKTQLVAGHNISALTGGEVVDAETVNSYITDPDTIVISDENGKDISANYEIVSILDGTLTVTPREIVITAGSSSKTYDGTPLTCDEYSVTSEFETPLADGQKITSVTIFGTITNAGEQDNEAVNCTVMWGDKDVTDNYAVKYSVGSLVVTKRPVTILTSSNSEEDKIIYDAERHSFEYFEEVEEDNINTGILYGHSAYVKEVFYATDAGTYPNALAFGIAGESDVTDNYKITVLYGSLKISPRPVTVITQSMQFEYDAQPHGFAGHTVSEQTPLALSTHVTSAYNLSTVTDVLKDGEQPVKNEMQISVFDGGSNDISFNYAVTVEPEGILTVTPLHISVVSDSISVMYNGGRNSYNCALTAEDSNSLISGHEFTFITFTEVVDVRHDEDGNVIYTDENKTCVAGYPNELTVGVKSGATDVSHNYVIDQYTYGTITVTPRPIKFVTATKTWIFDGQYHSESVLEDVDRRLLDGAPYYHLPACIGSELPRIKYVKEEVLNIFKIYIVNAEAQDISYNYDIAYEYGTLRISPLPITVTANSQSKIYDGEPLTDEGVEVTANGYKTEFASIINSGYTFVATVEGTITNAGTADNEVDKESFLVLDGKEQPVGLDNFDINFVKGILEIIPRKITVKAGDAQKTYDGKPLECKGVENCTVTSGHSPKLEPAIVAGQTLSVIINSSYTDAGEWDNVIDTCTITDAHGADVTDNYSITKQNGTITIDRREITITTLSKTDFIYDGEENFYLEYEITEGTLADGQTDRVDTEQEYTKVINAEEKDNVFTVIIFERDTNVSENYLITYNENCGKIKVNARPIIVKTGSAEKEFDGKPLSCKEISVSENSEYGLVEGHGFKITLTLTQTGVKRDQDGNVEGIKNENEFIIIDGNNINVTSNYDIIDCEYGTLLLKPRPIYVFVRNSRKEYDGTADVNPENYILDAYYNGENSEGYFEGPLVHALGYKISAEVVGYNCEIGADAGDYDICIVGGSVAIMNGGKDVSYNYEIETSKLPAVLTVTPREIIVIPSNDQKEYDGTPLTNHEVEFENLVDGHTATIEITGTQTDAGSSENTCDTDSLKVFAGEVDVTRNYRIGGVMGRSLTVTPRPIRVTTQTDGKLYDGTPLTNGGYEIEGLLEGHTATIDVTGQQLNIGSSENTADEESLAVIDADGKEINKNNYHINADYGTLTVKGKLTIETASAEKVYDGIPLTKNGEDDYKITESVLPEGFTVTIEITGEQTDAGSSENTFSWRLYDDTGAELSDIFIEFTPAFGTLKVTPRPLTISSGSATKVYDGTPLKYDKTEMTEGSLVEGHSTSVYVTGEQTEVGSSANTFEVDVHDGNGNSVLHNYVITKDYGILTVTEDTETSDSDSVCVRLKSDIGGTVYLRELSWGDYISGMAWTFATPYSGTLQKGGAEYGYNYLTSLMMQNSYGGKTGKVDIELLYNSYILPYYTTAENNHVIQTGDTVYSGDGTLAYSVNYMNYDYLTMPAPRTDGTWSVQELKYRQFVKDNYLTVDSTTREFLEGVIEENKLSADDISGVAEYIKGSATYNLKADYSQLESSQNVIISFLRDSQYGVCRHYATAATMLYRTLGIPARYTVGFAASLRAGEWTELTVGHAWVELYIDGLGWVMVEVTPPSSMPGGGDTSIYKYNINLKPRDEAKTYDGTQLVATELEADLTLIRLLELDYKYEVRFAGSQTQVGQSQSSISSFILYAPDGSVYEDVGYTFENGLLTVADKQVVTVHTYSKQQEYNGSPMYFKNNEYYLSGLPQGYRAEVIGLNEVGFAEAGILRANELKALITVRIYDAQGADKTSDFYLHYDPDFIITKCAITLATRSITKEYDGNELTDSGQPELTFGSLIKGHSIKVTSRSSITEAGEALNRMGYMIVDGNGNDVSENYDVTEVYGVLTITEGD